MHRILRSLRSNAIAYVALFVSLAGTGYATVMVANHSITPVKLNRGSIAGYTRAWAIVEGNGHVSASPGVRVVAVPQIAPGHYNIYWHLFATTICHSVGSVGVGRGAITPGYVVTQTSRSFPRRHLREQGVAQVYGANGQPAALPFSVDLVCGTPR